MDFGCKFYFLFFIELDDILNEDDGGYVPTGLKKQRPQSSRGGFGLSRQNSTKSIVSNQEKKPQAFTSGNTGFKNTSIMNDGLNIPKATGFSSTNNVSMLNNIAGTEKDVYGLSAQPSPAASNSRKNTLFGAHKQSAFNTNNSFDKRQPSPVPGTATTFQDFFKSQNQTPAPRPPLPQKRLQKNNSASNFNLGTPQDIINDDEFSSVASRRGRPPIRKTAHFDSNDDSLLGNNRSETYNKKDGLSLLDRNNQSTNFGQNSVQVPIYNSGKHTQQGNPNFNSQTIDNQTIKEMKALFSQQLEFQKSSMQKMLKDCNHSHQQQIEKLKSLHSEQLTKKLKLKEFELEKCKQFYEMQIKLYKQRENELREYSTLNRKLQQNISSIEKMQKSFVDKEKSYANEKKSAKEIELQRKQSQLTAKIQEYQLDAMRLKEDQINFKKQKSQLLQTLTQEKERLYELESSLRRKQNDLQNSFKRKQRELVSEYQKKSQSLQQKMSQAKFQLLELKEKQTFIQAEKQQLLNSKKQFQSQKRNSLQALHQQRTKVMQQQIQLSSRASQIDLKYQQIQMNQKQYINKLKIIELQKKRLDIERKNNRNQLSNTGVSGGVGSFGFKTTIGTGQQNSRLLGRTNQFRDSDTLKRQFFSRGENTVVVDEYQSDIHRNNETNPYKKSVTQLRDQFLRSLPKF